MDDQGLVASHAFATTLSLAACWDSIVAVAHGAQVQSFQLKSPNGQLLPVASFDFSQQVSALAIVQLPSNTGQVRVPGLMSQPLFA